METRIYVKNGWRNVNPTKPPASSRELDSFLLYNNAPKCFVKTNNYWFKLKPNGKMSKVSRVLYTLPLQDWIKIAMNKNY